MSVVPKRLDGWIKMPLGMEVGFGAGDFVLDGDPAPPPRERGHRFPQFSAHVYCGQTARWIKMPLGREVGLASGDIVLDWAQLPPYCGQTVAHLSYC